MSRTGAVGRRSLSRAGSRLINFGDGPPGGDSQISQCRVHLAFDFHASTCKAFDRFQKGLVHHLELLTSMIYTSLGAQSSPQSKAGTHRDGLNVGKGRPCKFHTSFLQYRCGGLQLSGGHSHIMGRG